MTITGINLTIAVGLVSAIGEVGRFSSSEKLVSYFGLNPRVRAASPAGPVAGTRAPGRGRLGRGGDSGAGPRLLPPGQSPPWTAGRRGRDGPQIAVLVWHLLTKHEDYAFGRPALHQIKAGLPSKRGGNAPGRAKECATLSGPS